MTSNVSRTYADLDLNFGANPVTKDVNRKVGDRAIVTAVKNLILLNYFEKPFNPSIGSNVRRLLFEPMTAETGILLQKEIELTIANYEPRVKLRNVYVQSDYDNQGYNITIEFFIVNRLEPVTVSIFLERLR
jgi:phage baseplate assembly protein W